MSRICPRHVQACLSYFAKVLSSYDHLHPLPESALVEAGVLLLL